VVAIDNGENGKLSKYIEKKKKLHHGFEPCTNTVHLTLCQCSNHYATRKAAKFRFEIALYILRLEQFTGTYTEGQKFGNTTYIVQYLGPDIAWKNMELGVHTSSILTDIHSNF
jgi:hypothetical protein